MKKYGTFMFQNYISFMQESRNILPFSVACIKSDSWSTGVLMCIILTSGSFFSYEQSSI